MYTFHGLSLYCDGIWTNIKINIYFMLRIKSKGTIVQEADKDVLKKHAELLLEKSQEIIKQKIQRMQSKEAKIQAIQKHFVEWAGQKQLSLKQRLQKSSKNKQDHLKKIVKKCKDHEKYMGEKFKTYQSRKRQTLRQAWKKAEQYKQSLQIQRNSKNVSLQKNNQRAQTQVNQQMAQSLYITQNHNKKDDQKQYLTINYGINNNNQSKLYNNNASKQYWAQINKTFHQLKVPHPIVNVIQEQTEEQKNKMRVNEKLKQTLARFRLYSKREQESKIQQLGQKLDRIQRTRVKKMQLFKKKRESASRVLESEEEQQKDKKKVQKKGYRIHSQSLMKQKRVHDWSELNRQKRQYFQQTYVQNSNEYLEQQKMKQMKNSLSKQITQSTIQKSLFYERLNH